LDPKFKEFIQRTTDVGLKSGAFWWIDPGEDWNRQVDFILNNITGMKLSFVAIDMEQYNGVVKKLNKKLKWIYSPAKYSDKQISGAGQYIIEALDKALNIDVMTYTRTSFINEYAPSMLNWINKYKIWLAQKPNESIITYDAREAKEKGYIHCATWNEWQEKYALDPEGDWQPDLPKGINKWDIWQFSFDSVKLPGSESYMDLNWVKA
jgi:hypothetical protein